MNIFILDLENKPGALAKAAEAIAQKGINITAFSGVTCGGSGTVALLTNDEAGTRSALAAAGCTVKEHEVVTVTIENGPGTLAMATRKLADAGINVEAGLVTAMAGGNVTLAFATSDPAAARKILSSGEPVSIGTR
jgi:hypothetical protein